MQPVLQYIDSYYKHPIIYITENGCDVPGESQMELQESLNDTFRINYYQVSAACLWPRRRAGAVSSQSSAHLHAWLNVRACKLSSSFPSA